MSTKLSFAIDPLYSSEGKGSQPSWKVGLPSILSPNKSKGAGGVSANDVDCENWLSEINLTQYLEVFLINFSDKNSRLLNRKKLSEVRLDHLPNMGITQFHHQKLLMDHIRHTLLFEFHSPVRRREVQAKMQALGGDQTAKNKFKGSVLPLTIPEFQGEKAPKKFADHGKKAAPTRRRSFDKSVWQSISKLRTADAASLSVVEALRDGNFEAAEKLENKTNERRRRRRTFGEGDPSSDSRNKGHEYGNKVQHFSMMQKELHELQSTHLAKLKRLVRCEHASIYFLNEKTRELLLATESGIWFRLTRGSGVAGHCVDHGEMIHVIDAYSDPRFNSNLDEKTGWKTKNILIHPLRGQRGGGVVIGAVQCINKVEGYDFDSSDEEHLAVCCQRIADELHVHFQDLLHIAENVAGVAIFVGDKGGHGHFRGEGERLVTAPTAASKNASRPKDNHISEPTWH